MTFKIPKNLLLLVGRSTSWTSVTTFGKRVKTMLVKGVIAKKMNGRNLESGSASRAFVGLENLNTGNFGVKDCINVIKK